MNAHLPMRLVTRTRSPAYSQSRILYSIPGPERTFSDSARTTAKMPTTRVGTAVKRVGNGVRVLAICAVGVGIPPIVATMQAKVPTATMQSANTRRQLFFIRQHQLPLVIPGAAIHDQRRHLMAIMYDGRPGAAHSRQLCPVDGVAHCLQHGQFVADI